MRQFQLIFFTLLIYLFIFVNKAQTEVVKKINVIGNDRITSETIIVFGDIQKDQNYEAEDINILIKKLFDTTFFSNIVVELSDGVLNIEVEENPIVNSIVFKGIKAQKYRKALLEYLGLKEKSSFLKNAVKKDVKVIRDFYRAQGFYFVEVEVVTEQLEGNRVDLVYTVDRGERAKITKIYFTGDKKLKNKKLRDIITSEESKFWKFISKSVYLHKDRIELDKRLLKNYYLNKGFYEAQITSSNVEYTEGEGFILSYTINAGKKYKFKKIFVNVAPELDKSIFVSLDKNFKDVVGDYYAKRKLEKILKEIDKLSQQKELQFINHSVTETLEGDGVTVQINIFEGKKFLVERINVIGNNVTNETVIRSEMIVDEGDPYSALLVNKSINRLKSRNLFKNVKSKILEGSSDDLKILEIEVEEQPTGEVSAGAGIGTEGGTFEFMITENNWLGKGVRLATNLNITEQSLRGGVSVENPNYNYSGNLVKGHLQSVKTDRSTSSGYESTRTGFGLGTEFEQYENLFLSPEIAFSYEEIRADSSASNSIKKMDGTYKTFDFMYGIMVDKRDQYFQPTDGYRMRFVQKLPLISDSASILNGIEHSAYHQFKEDYVVSVKTYARAINGLDEDVRLTDRLYLSQNRLRGFVATKVGPRDSGDYIGGNYTAGISFESTIPSLLPEDLQTDFSVFMDNGNVWGVDYDKSLDSSNKLRSSLGIAANMRTPLGPLSFTLADTLASADSDVTQTFSFRLGTSF